MQGHHAGTEKTGPAVFFKILKNAAGPVFQQSEDKALSLKTPSSYLLR